MPADNTAYTLRTYVLALWDIAPFGRNVVYAGNVRLCKKSKNLIKSCKRWEKEAKY